MLLNFMKSPLNDIQCQQHHRHHHHHHHHQYKQQQRKYCDYQNVSKLLMCTIILLTLCPLTMQAPMYEGDDCVMASRPGICQLGSKCDTLKEGFKQGIFTNKDVVECGLAPYEQIVCCPLKLDMQTPKPAIEPAIEPVIDPAVSRIKDRPAVEACRKIDAGLTASISQHILGGTPVELGEYPHMAAIGYSRIGNDEGPYDFRCGGTLIDSRFVLTAAHCVNDRNGQPSIVRMGVTNFTDVEQMRDVVEIPIKKIHIHPEYKNSRKYNDIAILELESAAKLNANVYPTCLYMEPEDPPARLPVYVTGWGTINTATRQFSEILLKAKLELVDIDRCNASYIEVGLNRQIIDGIQKTQMCAYDPGNEKDACQGDSGGPLNVVIDESKFQYRVAGIVSAGFSCGSDTPGFYTRVSAFIEYIERIVWPLTPS